MLAGRSTGHVFKVQAPSSKGKAKFRRLPLSELNASGSGFLKHDVLKLRVEVKVKKEQRFQLDAGEAASSGALVAVKPQCF